MPSEEKVPAKDGSNASDINVTSSKSEDSETQMSKSMKHVSRDDNGSESSGESEESASSDEK